MFLNAPDYVRGVTARFSCVAGLRQKLEKIHRPAELLAPLHEERFVDLAVADEGLLRVRVGASLFFDQSRSITGTNA